ncbi:MAG TPA: hypothetical protein VGN95_24495, partial [Pyrinomonadaceae bacterium]|nr:hypothetical protein [Pyrinomonadaceae bacterium]
LLGILSILATIYFAVRYAERKEPRFFSLNERKIAISEDAPEDIQITYKGEKVTRVTSTLVWFWNNGKRPIKNDDLPTEQSLLIKLSDPDNKLEILDVSVRKISRESINFQATKKDSSTVGISFDFLDNNDGAAIEIQHTGARSTIVEISGVILGAAKGVRRMTRRTLLSSPLLPIRHNYVRRSRPSKILRFIITLILVFVFGGLSLFFLRLGEGEITTSRELLHPALENHLPNDAIDPIIQRIEETAKYKTRNKVMPYLFGGSFILYLLISLIILWRSPVAFPNALLIDDTGKKDSETDTPTTSIRTTPNNSLDRSRN